MNKPPAWFSEIQKTIEEAQDLHQHEMFQPAAVFEIKNDETVVGYVMARIKEQDCPPHKTADHIKGLLGYQMVSYCESLMGIWTKYNVQ